MKRKILYAAIFALFALTLGGCTMPFGQPEGPDSGEEIDQGPDSGEEIDTSDEPSSPDSGEEIDTSDEPNSPDSGEEADPSDEPSSPDSGEEEDVNGPDSGEEISLNDYLKAKAKFSCNAINYGSTCVEYIGSFWTKTNAKLNCSSDSAFATGPCPRPAVGGCRIGAETANEIVAWHYDYGGDPYTDEVVPYAAGSCKALPGASWVN